MNIGEKTKDEIIQELTAERDRWKRDFLESGHSEGCGVMPTPDGTHAFCCDTERCSQLRASEKFMYDFKAIRKERDEGNITISNLRSSLGTLREGMDEYRGRAERAEKELGATRGELDALSSGMAGLEARFEADHKQWASEKEDLRKARDNWQRAHESVNATKERLEEELASTTEALETLRRTHAANILEMTRADRELGELRTLLATAEMNAWAGSMKYKSDVRHADAVQEAVREGLPPREWSDRKDKWSAAIDAEFPTRSNEHGRFARALEMVECRYDKYALVALVNWLLARAERAEGLLKELRMLIRDGAGITDSDTVYKKVLQLVERAT